MLLAVFSFHRTDWEMANAPTIVVVTKISLIIGATIYAVIVFSELLAGIALWLFMMISYRIYRWLKLEPQSHKLSKYIAPESTDGDNVP